MKIGNREFDLEHRTYVCGILNITPDSFSDGGKYSQPDKALRRVEEMVKEGADLIDIGGESTRPGYSFVSAEVELERLLPVLDRIKVNFDIPISVDTTKYEVARECLNHKADMINDIWGLRKSKELAQLIAKREVPCVLTHNRDNTEYRNFLEDVAADLSCCVSIAEEAGIRSDRIILDPGVGFAKSVEQNLCVINCLCSFRRLGYPILLGTSRKSVIGKTLDLPPSECMEGTLATTVLAVLAGCSIVRVHDVKENVRVIKMTEAVMKRGVI